MRMGLVCVRFLWQPLALTGLEVPCCRRQGGVQEDMSAFRVGQCPLFSNISRCGFAFPSAVSW